MEEKKSEHVHMAELLQQVLGLKLDVYKPNYRAWMYSHYSFQLNMAWYCQEGRVIETQTEKEMTSVNYISPTSVSLSGYQTPALDTVHVWRLESERINQKERLLNLCYIFTIDKAVMHLQVYTHKHTNVPTGYSSDRCTVRHSNATSWP